MSPARWPTIVAAVACLSAGCGGSGGDGGGTTGTATTARTVSTDAVEQEMKQALSTSTVQVSKATCPDHVSAAAGTTFTCSVAWANGAVGEVKVTTGPAKHYTYEPVAGSVKVPGATVEQLLQDELAKQGASAAAVNCPDTIIVKVGTTVTCDAVGAGGSATGSVTFSFSSADGTIDPSTVKATGAA